MIGPADGSRSRSDSTTDGGLAHTRRGVLASLGSGAVAVVAGCTDVSGDPTYEDGDVEDVDGDARSPEELVAAAALAEQEIRDSVTPLETLTLADHEFVLEDGYTGATVQGVVENTADERVDVAEVRVRVYGDADQLGRYVAHTGDIDGGATWSFTVVILESPDDIHGYDVAVLGTPS